MSAVAPESDDEQLLRSICAHDEAAFARLYDRLSRPVFSLVLQILRVHSEAEEVLQDAFWQVWQHAADYRAELGSPFCWIVTIARRKAIDRLRANARHLRRIEDASAARAEDDFAPAVALETISRGETHDLVRAALAKLNAEERRTIALAFFDGLTHEEIAGALGAPVGTVKARIRRGLMKLQPALDPLRRASGF